MRPNSRSRWGWLWRIAVATTSIASVAAVIASRVTSWSSEVAPGLSQSYDIRVMNGYLLIVKQWNPPPKSVIEIQSVTTPVQLTETIGSGAKSSKQIRTKNVINSCSNSFGLRALDSYAYVESLILLLDYDGSRHPPGVLIQFDPPGKLYSLCVAWWLIALVVLPLGLLPLAFSILRLIQSRHRKLSGHCNGCGYDLTGNVSGCCPECGREASVTSPSATG